MPPPPTIDAILRDGRPVRLRAVRPDDRERLAAGFAHLSEESRLRRFHAAMPKLSEQMLGYFTEVDQHDHVAWGAVDPTDPDERGLGVVRAERQPGETELAEVAVTVIDELQCQGLGTLLVCLIASLAAREGIATLRFVTTEDNAGMIGLVRRLGGVRSGVEYPEVTYDLALPITAPIRPEVRRVMDAVAG